MTTSQLRPLRLIALAGALALALALAACGGGGGTTSATSAETGAAAGGGGGGASGGGGTIGFSIPQGANTSLQALDKGLKSEAQKAGLQVNTVDANLDPSKQIADINTLIQQKVKAIVVWPLDDHAVQPAIKQAAAANIPVIAIYALSGGPYYTDLILEGEQVGRDAAKWFADNLPQDSKVAAIFGPPQVTQFRQIAEGFKAEAKASGLNLVESQVDPKLLPEDAVNLTNDFKQRYGASLKGLWVTLESMGLGSASVVGGDFQPKIATYGGTDDSLDGLKSGKFAISYFQNPTLMGRMAGWAAGQAVSGKKLPAKIYLQVPGITPERAKTFPDEAEQLTKPYDFKPVKQNGQWTMPMFK